MTQQKIPPQLEQQKQSLNFFLLAGWLAGWLRWLAGCAGWLAALAGYVPAKSLNFFLGSIRKFLGNCLMDPGSDTPGCIRKFSGNCLMRPPWDDEFKIGSSQIIQIWLKRECVGKLPGNFLMDPRCWDLVPSTWHFVLGTKYLVLGTRFLVHFLPSKSYAFVC